MSFTPPCVSSRPRGLWIAAALAVAAAWLSGCRGGSGAALVDIARWEDERAADRPEWEDLLLRGKTSRIRARAALAVGRMRDQRLVAELRRALDVEEDASVRAAQLFALGQLGSDEAIPPTMRALGEPRSDVRSGAAEALGKIGDPTTTAALIEALSDSDEDVCCQAILALVRVRGRRAGPVQPLDLATGQALLQELIGLARADDAGVRWRAVYALSEIEIDGRRDALVQAITDADRRCRLFAVRGLARLGTARDELVGVLVDENVHVAAAAAAGLAGSRDDEKVAALVDAAGRMARPADQHVRRASVAALGAPAGDTAGAAPVPARAVRCLREALVDDFHSVRAEALLGLARVAPESTTDEIVRWLKADSPLTRLAAVRAAAVIGHDFFLRVTVGDPPGPDPARWPARGTLADPAAAVVCAWIEVWKELEAAAATGASSDPDGLVSKDASRSLALSLLDHQDFAVRATALGLLAGCGRPEDVRRVREVYLDDFGPRYVESRVEAVRTAGRLQGNEALRFLRETLEDPSPAVRQVARDLLVELTSEMPVMPPAVERTSSMHLVEGVDYLSHARNPRATLHTSRGPIVLELLREEAPHHVRSFLDLAWVGRYDGLPFHRVVTGFVVQGLDPRGDGWGTGGVFLRDEINQVPYLTGTVGMPNAGPDTGGCQIFITHVPTPHLDGRYTVFGRVVEGMEVVHTLDVGDLCLEVEVTR